MKRMIATLSALAIILIATGQAPNNAPVTAMRTKRPGQAKSVQSEVPARPSESASNQTEESGDRAVKAVAPTAPKPNGPPTKQVTAPRQQQAPRPTQDLRPEDADHETEQQCRRGRRPPLRRPRVPHRHGFAWHFRFWPRIIFVHCPVVCPRWEYVPRKGSGVHIVMTGSDPVGLSFASALREELRNVGLVPVYDSDRATLELYVASLEQNSQHPGSCSSISVTYVWCPGYRFITTHLLDVRDYETEDFASSVADYADELIDYYR